MIKTDMESMCICKDYKLTANVVLKLKQYLIPCVEDLFPTVSGDKYFTKLDMNHAHQQIPSSML